MFGASYLVLGLGDVYLGAPVATPVDPRHRLVTTKYNPARTWTPENAVGIGGAYLCVYGMEGPGGYQFVGRTCQMWNPYRTTREFEQPWLLRHFDQLRFHPVSHEELLRFRADFLLGRAQLRITEEVFRLRDHRALPGGPRRGDRRLHAAPAGRLRGGAGALGGSGPRRRPGGAARCRRDGGGRAAARRRGRPQPGAGQRLEAARPRPGARSAPAIRC